MKKRLISIVLCLMILLSSISCLSVLTTSAASVELAPTGATQNQLNIVSRADYMFNSTWVSKKTVKGWGGTFYAGNTYRIPYGQPVTTGKYVGFDSFGITESTFHAAAADPNSIFYTQRSSYSGNYSTYYANDCSAFVSYCWGVTRKTTATIPGISTNLGKATESNIRSKLQLGDALNYSGSHVVLVTGLTYSGSTLTQIEITEQTPPQLKRSYYTPASLAAKYSSKYTIYRYTGNVPSAPGQVEVPQEHPLKSNPTHNKLKPYVFDAAFYYSRYEDLQKNIGLDEAKLYDHFLENGIKEGRCASPYFDVKWYMEQNDQGLRDYCNGDYMKAYEHFLQYVQDENEMLLPRKLSKIFDINYYKNTYNDLRAIGWKTEYDYLVHFATAGVNEGRQGSAEFDPVSYAYFNSDVNDAFKSNIKGLYSHYMCYGMFESNNPERAKINNLANYGSSFYATISEINTGKVLELVYGTENSSFEDSNAVQINTPSGADSQLWKFQRQADGTYKITNVAYNKALDGEGYYLGARTEDGGFTGVDFQSWKIYNKDGNCVFKPNGHSQVLDVAISYNDYSPVIKETFNGSPNQMFRINIACENYGDNFTAKINTMCNGSFYLSINESASAVMESENGLNEQLWDFHRLSDGSYRITNKENGKALAVKDSATENYTDICTEDYNGSAAHRWIIIREGDNMVSLRPLCGIGDNVTMDLAGIGSDMAIPEESNISLYEYTGVISQLFQITALSEDFGDKFKAKIKTSCDENFVLSLNSSESVVVKTDTNADEQIWEFEKQSDSTYKIKNTLTGKYIECFGGLIADKTDVITCESSESVAQRWIITSASDGMVILRPLSGIKANVAMDLYGMTSSSVISEESNISIYKFNDSEAQRFVLEIENDPVEPSVPSVTEPEETPTEPTEPTDAPWETMPTFPEKEDVYHTVVFVDYDGRYIDSQLVKDGESAVLPEEPQRESDEGFIYTFAGWDSSFANITSDVVITATYTVKFSSFTVTFVDKDGSTIDEQIVDYGSAVTAPTAPDVEGFEFIGWSENYDCVTDNLVVKAEYKKIETPPTPATTGTLKIELSGGSSFTIAINDGVARPQGSTFTSTSVPVGATVTVVANATGDKEFIGWVNPATGFVATTDYEFTFTTSGNDSYKAVFNTKVDGVNMVSFYNEVTKQYLDVQYYAATDEIVWPTVDPVQAGYDFVGWNMTAEEIAAELAAGKDVTVLPEWEKQLVYVTLEVVNGTVTAGEEKDGKYLANTKTTVKANAAADGYKFAYWTLDGKVVTYNEEYSFYPKADAKLEAVFVTEDTTVEYEVLAEVSSFTATQYGQFGISWYVPEAQNNLTYKGAGIVAVKENLYNESTFVHGTTDANVWDRSLNTDKANGSAVWTGPVYSGETWVAACWVQYTDNATGETVVIYSDLFTVTKL